VGKRTPKEKGKSTGKKGADNVSALPLPEPLPPERMVELSGEARWKLRAFQETAERAKAVVKAAHTELLLRQSELQQANRELQGVVDEVKLTLAEEIPEGYVLEQLNPLEGKALCRLVPSPPQEE
jgi:hypothetical protein